MNIDISPDLRSFFGARYVIPVGSGTTALFLMLKAIDVKNRKVILPALTCPNVVVAVLAAGGTPVLADISSSDCNISIDSASIVMDSRVKAIIAVDSFGYPADIDSLLELAAPYECLVLEDACQAYGGQVGETPLGSRGDIGIVSFGYSKPIDIGIGGCLITDSEELQDLIVHKLSLFSGDMLSKFKNSVIRSVSLKNNYKRFRFLAKYLNLLNCIFPKEYKNNLCGAWKKFENDLPGMKANLRCINHLISKLKDLDQFAYTEEEWLPWRYSFMVSEERNQIRLREMCTDLKIKHSRLYKPLDEIFPRIQVADSLKNARRVSSTIFNLRYIHTLESTKKIVAKVNRIIELW